MSMIERGFGIAVLALTLGAPAASAQPVAEKPADTDAAAVVGDRTITLAEVDKVALQMEAGSFGSLKLHQALYEARRTVLISLVGDALLEKEAAARGVTLPAFVQQEIGAKVPPVGDTEISAWFRDNQERVRGATLDQVREPIRNFLMEQRTQETRDSVVARLKEKTPVRMFLEPPRQAVRTMPNDPVLGPITAPIEIVEFSDFECPFCQRASATIHEVVAAYGDRVKIVYRDFPLQNHAHARLAAEAGQCAAEQSQFWKYHDRLFANQAKLQDADLKAHAVAIGLDAAKFTACLDARKYKDAVDQDMADGESYGVMATPAFFVNGRFVNGAQPFERFKSIIDEELERRASTK